LKTSGSNDDKITKLQALFTQSKNGSRGLAELTKVFEILNHYGSTQAQIEFDISLARGLSYYTGTIFEVKVNNVSIGSVSGGGRYDNLTQAFGAKEKLSGVGISFGIDRIYDVMEELDLFPKETIQFTKVLVVHMDEPSMNFGFRVAQSLRANNVATEIYPDQTKVKKQLDYANKKQIPFAVIIGPDEMAAGQVALKNLLSGEQETLDLNQLIEKLS
jgi:histidyl-tRNA synthetase